MKQEQLNTMTRKEKSLIEEAEKRTIISSKKYSTPKLREYMISKAKCSDKPIRIPYCLYHDSKIGLIKID